MTNCSYTFVCILQFLFLFLYNCHAAFRSALASPVWGYSRLCDQYSTGTVSVDI
uniref:Uncharacterized protein n=2 Tax=Anguilla anguilla TaxID=7936 RepID=A0A0E9PUZ9_ANGAN